MKEIKGSLRPSVDTCESRPNDTIEIARSIAELKASKSSASSSNSQNQPFYLPDLIQLEYKALESGELKDACALWSLPLYSQRKYWFKIFIGFHYGIFADFLTNWTMRGIPDPSFSEPALQLYEYLGKNAGIQSMEDVFGEITLETSFQHLKAKPTSESVLVLRHKVESIRSFTPIKALRSRLSLESFHLGPRRNSLNSDIKKLVAENPLTQDDRQSKLSQEQLSELQRSTHFDKKELQQWYKGMFGFMFAG